MIPVLETERLTLRAPEAGDMALYAAFYAQSSGAGTYGGPRQAHEAFRQLAADLGHWHLKGHGKWILARRDGGEAIGGCGLIHPDGWPSHELTWWLMPAARGKGYATEASCAAIRFGYDTLGWDPVETHMRDGNTAAHGMAKRLGGTVTRRETFPDGVIRDVYALPHPGDA